MPGRLVVISGTGTGIGKTHFAEALLLAVRADGRTAVGLKPVESGVLPGREGDSDAARLAQASSFHVKHDAIALAEQLSPHLAARRASVAITPDIYDAPAAVAVAQADVAVLELPGGLFSPLGRRLLNVDIAARLRPHALLLVAPDRLGVLHDVTSTVRAAHAACAAPTGIVLMAPEPPDPSTGLNAAELSALVPTPVLAAFPRAPSAHLARSPQIASILHQLLG